jgi:O-antigen ligase
MAITRYSDAGHGVASTDSEVVRPQLRWAFYALVASIPFERVDIGVPISAARIAGYGFFLIALLQPSISFRRPPAAFWCFATYVLIFALLMVFQPPELLEEILDRLLTLTQLLLLFWIAYNLMRYPRVAGGALLALGVSGAACALLQVAGLSAAEAADERVAAFGQNPNELSSILALGLLALLGLCYRRERSALSFGLAWPLIAVLGMAIIQTSSRGGLLALGSGLVVFVGVAGTRFAWIRRALFLVLGIALLVGLSYFSESNRRRWEETLIAGDLAHREILYPAAWQMFTEEPVAGWGPVTALYQLGGRTKFVNWPNPEESKRDTHNLALHVLTATGLLGTIPFVAGILLCVWSAFRARRGVEGILPLAMAISLLVSNMSGDRLYMKFHWLVLAYALASGYQVAVRRLPTRPPRSSTPPAPLAVVSRV